MLVCGIRLLCPVPRRGLWLILALHGLTQVPLCNQLWILVIHVWLYVREPAKAFHASCVSDSSHAAASLNCVISEEQLQASSVFYGSSFRLH